MLLVLFNKIRVHSYDIVFCSFLVSSLGPLISVINDPVNRGQYDGRNVSGARMWLEVGATEDSMVDAMYQEPGCGWR